MKETQGTIYFYNKFSDLIKGAFEKRRYYEEFKDLPGMVERIAEAKESGIWGLCLPGSKEIHILDRTLKDHTDTLVNVAHELGHLHYQRKFKQARPEEGLVEDIGRITGDAYLIMMAYGGNVSIGNYNEDINVPTHDGLGYIVRVVR